MASTVRRSFRLFQYTPLREGRQRMLEIRQELGKFQYTPLGEGRQSASHPYHRQQDISIHAPTRGATLPPLWRCGLSYFNSRPWVRGDTMAAFTSCSIIRFQYTPLREGRLTLEMEVNNEIYFNSRPCVRGDDLSQQHWPTVRNFNSRPCVRGDPQPALR